MRVTITKIEKYFWRAGILMSCFSGDGFRGYCNSLNYRHKMLSANVTIEGIGQRGFALASMPVEWVPAVGDVVEIHESQL